MTNEELDKTLDYLDRITQKLSQLEPYKMDQEKVGLVYISVDSAGQKLQKLHEECEKYAEKGLVDNWHDCHKENNEAMVWRGSFGNQWR